MTDIVKIGDATLYHGDCLEILKTFKEHSVDLVLLDTPYGVGISETENISKAHREFEDNKDSAMKLLEDIIVAQASPKARARLMDIHSNY